MSARFAVPRIHWAIVLVCLLLLLPQPVIALYDRSHPWPIALTKLRQAYPNQVPVCIRWFNGKFWQQTPTETRSLTLVSRSYLLFPRAFYYPTMVTVTADQSGESRVEESWLFWLAPEVGFYAIVLLVLALKALQFFGVLPISKPSRLAR